MRLRNRMLSRSEAKNKSFDRRWQISLGWRVGLRGFPVSYAWIQSWRRSRLERGLTHRVYWECSSIDRVQERP
jgi:hypothetical protein